MFINQTKTRVAGTDTEILLLYFIPTWSIDHTIETSKKINNKVLICDLFDDYLQQYRTAVRHVLELTPFDSRTYYLTCTFFRYYY